MKLTTFSKSLLLGFLTTGQVHAATVLNFTDFDNEATKVDVIPEPTSTSLLGLGGLALLARRRRA